jgi:hypothetical protein
MALFSGCTARLHWHCSLAGRSASSPPGSSSPQSSNVLRAKGNSQTWFHSIQRDSLTVLFATKTTVKMGCWTAGETVLQAAAPPPIWNGIPRAQRQMSPAVVWCARTLAPCSFPPLTASAGREPTIAWPATTRTASCCLNWS